VQVNEKVIPEREIRRLAMSAIKELAWYAGYLTFAAQALRMTAAAEAELNKTLVDIIELTADAAALLDCEGAEETNDSLADKSQKE
jgi:hypothetical protein